MSECNECIKACQADFGKNVKPGSNHINYSINMAGVESCSHNCVYCSAATTLNYAQGVNHTNLEESIRKVDEKTYSEFKADFNKLEETFLHNDRFLRAKEIQEKQGVQAEVAIDLWGADPVTCHLATQETVDFCKDFFEKKHGMKLKLSSSTGGLPLVRKDICDYYIENNITLQISHDGCGQWMRTKEIDPLYDDRMAGNIANLFQLGILNLVNDCLNFYNYDVFANKKYWDTYFASLHLKPEIYNKLYVKLNRTYDGIYDLKQKNVDGIFGSDKRQWEELKGKPFGNINHHNWKNANTGNVELDHLLAHELDAYLNDWLKLGILMKDPKVLQSPNWKPYISYIKGQVNRWMPMKDHNDSFGSCRRYQRTIHKIGDPRFWQKPNSFGIIENWIVDTLGGYCECNLIDSEHTTKNPGGGVEPEHCKYCKYYDQSECMGCGSEEVNPDCEFRYRWVAMLEQIKLLDAVMPNYAAKSKEAQQMYQKGKQDAKQEIALQMLDNFIKSPNSNLIVPGNACNCKGPNKSNK